MFKESRRANQVAVNADLNSAGRNEGVADQIEVRPCILQDTVVWPMDLALAPRQFFNPSTKTPAAYAGVKPYPENYKTKFVVIEAVEFVPDMLLLPFETGGTTADAYAHFLRTTQINFRIEGRDVFPAPLTPLMVHRSIAPGSGTQVLVSNTTSFTVDLPEPIEIPVGKSLVIDIVPSTSLITGATAVTNSHYPGGFEGLASNNRGCGLSVFCYGNEADQAW